MRKLMAALLVVGAAVFARPASAQEKDFVVIVNAFNPFVTIKVQDLSQLFLKKSGTWSNGQPAMPVDQAETSPLRRKFTTRILNRDVDAVRSYWQQMVFSGKAVPPPVLDSDAAVVEFVRHNPYAVGYVSPTTQLTADVRVIALYRD